MGWRPEFVSRFAPWFDELKLAELKPAELKFADLQPARVAVRYNRNYQILCEAGELLAEVAGKLAHSARGAQELPAVGDWVAAQLRPAEGRATIHAVLPRHTCFSRKAAGRAAEEQIIAANVDVVLLLAGLDNDYSPRRIERYLAAAWDSGATPVVVLNKADLCANVDERIAEVQRVAPGVPLHAISALRGDGLELIEQHMAPGRTLALLGSSGVGKSTLINRLLGAELLATAPVREDDSRGRHTTTRRQLILLPGDALHGSRGLILDTPGMRELQLWNADEGLHLAFDEVESLAASCRFADCSHVAEPGCAVREAVERGELPPERLESFQKMQRELRFLERRQDKWAGLKEKKRWKAIHRAANRFYRE